MKHLTILLLTAFQAFSCGWINGTNIDGVIYETNSYAPYQAHPNDLQESLITTPLNKLEYFEDNFSKKERESEISKAVFSMLKGDYKTAISSLLLQEKQIKDSYEIATNLGTAYELNGDNEKALKWIEEGLKRNPDSHFGTEWLHVKILETKLRLQENPDYLKQNHILHEEDLYNYMANKSLLYQLRERMLFVKPKDSIVADLLYLYALSNAKTNGFLEYSLEALELSRSYGYANTNELESTIKTYQSIIDYAQFMQLMKILGIIGVFIVLLFIAYKKKLFFLTQKEKEAYMASKKKQD